jgi:hypothetical protein
MPAAGYSVAASVVAVSAWGWSLGAVVCIMPYWFVGLFKARRFVGRLIFLWVRCGASASCRNALRDSYSATLGANLHGVVASCR